MFKFIAFLGCIGCASTALVFAAESNYVSAYGKFYREYSRHLDNAAVSGKPLSKEERTRVRQELYADVKKGYGKDMASLHQRIREMGKGVSNEIRAQKKVGPSNLKIKDDKPAVPTLARDNAIRAPATEAARINSASGGKKVETGTAERVSFSKDAGAPGSGASAGAGGAEDVSFSAE